MRSVTSFVTVFLAVLFTFLVRFSICATGSANILSCSDVKREGSNQITESHISDRLKRACSGSSVTGSQLPCIPARTNCVLPEYLENGKWRVLGDAGRNGGEIVRAWTILEFECDPGYKLLPEVRFSVCNKQWSDLPICMKTCGSLHSTDVMHIGCSLYNIEISCTNPYNGTRARISCAATYNDPSLKDRPYLKCIDGEWDGPLPECKKVSEPFLLSPIVAPQLGGSTCVLPEYPKNGKWYSFDKKTPGDTVAPYSLITYECDKGYKEYPEKKNVICLNGTFAAPICSRTCRSIEDSSSMFANCFYRGQPTSCKNPYTFTRVRFSCGYMYKKSYTKTYDLTCLRGSWNHPIPTCTPVCGVRSLIALNLTRTEIRKIVPWMTTIYDNKDAYICAGTLVAQHAVITTAHCFTNTKGRYTVAIRNSRGENHLQSKVVSELIKHENYQEVSLSNDIAILILQKPFKMSKTVVPACLDYTSLLGKLEVNEIGQIAGYPTNQDKVLSGPLQTLEMLYQTVETCPSPSISANVFLGDKFCATMRVEGETIDAGFGSSGLTFLGSDGLYYMRGIAVYSYIEEHTTLPVIVFTDIEYNIEFIRKSLELGNQQ